MLIKVRVKAGLLGRYPPGRIVYQHQFQKVQAIFVKVIAEFLAEVALPFREGALKVWVGCDAGPALLCRSAKLAVASSARKP
jgi:hypothetical protein